MNQQSKDSATPYYMPLKMTRFGGFFLPSILRMGPEACRRDIKVSFTILWGQFNPTEKSMIEKSSFAKMLNFRIDDNGKPFFLRDPIKPVLTTHKISLAQYNMVLKLTVFNVTKSNISWI
jgi:hypothetical protein